MCATCILSLARLRQCCCCLALTGYLRRFGSTLVPMAGIWYGVWDGMAQQNHGKCTHHHQVVIPVRMCMLLVGMDGWMDMDGKCSFFLTVSCARSPPPPPASQPLLRPAQSVEKVRECRSGCVSASVCMES